MSSDSIEVQACLNDWTKAEFRQQEHEQTYEFFENEQTTGTEGSTWLQLPINRYKNYVGFDSSKPQEDT